MKTCRFLTVASILAVAAMVVMSTSAVAADFDATTDATTFAASMESYYQEWLHDYDGAGGLWTQSIDFSENDYSYTLMDSPGEWSSIYAIEWHEPGALSSGMTYGWFEIVPSVEVNAIGGYFFTTDWDGEFVASGGEIRVTYYAEDGSSESYTTGTAIDEFLGVFSSSPITKVKIEHDVIALCDFVTVDGIIIGTGRLPGDANHDGVVDISDLTVLSLNWEDASEDKTWEQGDFNGNKYVDISDLTILSGHWTPGGSSFAEALASIGTVPEPATFAMLIAGLVGLVAYAWRKR